MRNIKKSRFNDDLFEARDATPMKQYKTESIQTTSWSINCQNVKQYLSTSKNIKHFGSTKIGPQFQTFCNSAEISTY